MSDEPRWTCPVCGFAGPHRAAGRSDRLADLQHLPLLRHAVRRRRSRQAARRAAQGVGAGRRASGGRRTSRRPRAGTPTRSSRRLASPMAVRGTDVGDRRAASGSGWSICRRSSRACWRCGPSRASTSSSPPSGSCPTGCARSACSPAPSDDALFVALDEGTKAAPVEVVYARSFYAGSQSSVGAAVGRGDRRVRGARSRRGARGARRLRAHARARGVVLRRRRARASSRSSRTWCARRELPVARGGHRRRRADGVSDRAAARVDGRRSTRRSRRRRCAWPSGSARRRRPTIGGGYLVGDLPACEAAARAFAAAVVDVARAPTDAARSARAAGEALGARPRGRQGRGQLSRAGDGRAAQRQARAPDAPASTTSRSSTSRIRACRCAASSTRCRACCSTRSAPPTPTARAGSSASWARRSS